MANNDESLLVLAFGLLSITLAVVGPMIFDGLVATIMLICGALAGVVALMFLFNAFSESSDKS